MYIFCSNRQSNARLFGHWKMGFAAEWGEDYVIFRDVIVRYVIQYCYYLHIRRYKTHFIQYTLVYSLSIIPQDILYDFLSHNICNLFNSQYTYLKYLIGINPIDCLLYKYTVPCYIRKIIFIK